MSIHTKSAVDAIKRSPFQALSAIFVLALTFFVATTVFILVYASDKTLRYFETRPQIIAYIKDGSKESEINSIINKYMLDERIKSTKFVSKEEALEIYKKATSDNPLLSELVSPSIFPASVELSVKDIKKASDVIANLKDETVVEQVDFTANTGGEKSLDDVVGRLKTASDYIRFVGLGFAAVLAITSFIVLLVIITMRMNMRKGEVEILSLIGASASFVRSPVVIEAMLYSLIGVVLGFTTSFIMWLYVSPTIMNYFGEIEILPKDPLSFFGIFGLVFVVELISGLLISLFGSLIAVNRSLNKTR